MAPPSPLDRAGFAHGVRCPLFRLYTMPSPLSLSSYQGWARSGPRGLLSGRRRRGRPFHSRPLAHRPISTPPTGLRGPNLARSGSRLVLAMLPLQGTARAFRLYADEPSPNRHVQILMHAVTFERKVLPVDKVSSLGRTIPSPPPNPSPPRPDVDLGQRSSRTWWGFRSRRVRVRASDSS